MCWQPPKPCASWGQASAIWGTAFGRLAVVGKPVSKRQPRAGFRQPGTGARLVMGVVAGAGISAEFTGDASLSRRPMARVTKPLAQTGAQIEDNGTGRLPLTITGAAQPATWM